MDFVIDHRRSYKEGFNNLKPANYDNLYYAGFLEPLWLLGMNATRLYTVKHGGFAGIIY
jgi:DNA topoisomerase-3